MDKTKQYLSDEEIIQVIKSYIDEKLYNYAVMIDGEWGSGKTYFVKEVLIPQLKLHDVQKTGKRNSSKIKSIFKKAENKSRKFLYISLYGMKSVDDISKKIYMENYLDTDMKKKGYSIASMFSPLLFDAINNAIKLVGIKAKEDTIDESIKKLVGNFITLDNAVLIFDDLERCNIPINEVLGYINGYVEHQGMKVIIVANQKEINKESVENNQELKYLVASNENIDIPIEKDDKKEKSDDKLRVSNLKYRAEKIFDKQNEYDIIKEKLIGITIHYTPNLKTTLAHIISQVTVDDDLKKRIEMNVDFYISFMVKKKHTNFRTFQFYLSKLNSIYEKIKEYKENSDFIDYIVQYCFDVSCRFKVGIMYYEWNNESSPYLEVTGLNHYMYYYECPLRIRFVDEFVMYSHFNNDRLQETIDFYNRYYSPHAKESSKLVKSLQFGWYCSYESQVSEWINKLIEYMSKNLYDFSEYERIIDIILNIIEYAHFDDEILVKVKKAMLQNIKMSVEHHLFNQNYQVMIKNHDIKAKFILIVKELQNNMDKVNSQNINNQIIDIMSTRPDWVLEIIDLDQDKSTNHPNVIDIFQYVDVEFLAEKICESSVENLYEFRRYIGLWNEAYFDATKVEVLCNLLSKKTINNDDKIFQMNFQWLLEDLQRCSVRTE